MAPTRPAEDAAARSDPKQDDELPAAVAGVDNDLINNNETGDCPSVKQPEAMKRIKEKPKEESTTSPQGLFRQPQIMQQGTNTNRQPLGLSQGELSDHEHHATHVHTTATNHAAPRQPAALFQHPQAPPQHYTVGGAMNTATVHQQRTTANRGGTKKNQFGLSRIYYENTGKSKPVLLSIVVGLRGRPRASALVAGCDFRESPYKDVKKDKFDFKPKLRHLQDEVNRRSRDVYSIRGKPPQFKTVNKAFAWLVTHPLLDPSDIEYFSAEIDAYRWKIQLRVDEEQSKRKGSMYPSFGTGSVVPNDTPPMAAHPPGSPIGTATTAASTLVGDSSSHNRPAPPTQTHPPSQAKWAGDLPNSKSAKKPSEQDGGHRPASSTNFLKNAPYQPHARNAGPSQHSFPSQHSDASLLLSTRNGGREETPKYHNSPNNSVAAFAESTSGREPKDNDEHGHRDHNNADSAMTAGINHVQQLQKKTPTAEPSAEQDHNTTTASNNQMLLAAHATDNESQGNSAERQDSQEEVVARTSTAVATSVAGASSGMGGLRFRALSNDPTQNEEMAPQKQPTPQEERQGDHQEEHPHGDEEMAVVDDVPTTPAIVTAQRELLEGIYERLRSLVLAFCHSHDRDASVQRTHLERIIVSSGKVLKMKTALFELEDTHGVPHCPPAAADFNQQLVAAPNAANQPRGVELIVYHEELENSYNLLNMVTEDFVASQEQHRRLVTQKLLVTFQAEEVLTWKREVFRREDRQG